MIRSLTGELARKATDYIVVDVSGVGYRVTIPLSVYYRLPGIGETVKLIIYTQVREDAITLYGFESESELAVFELLTSISGIGPRLGCNILSGIGGAELAETIAAGDAAKLNAIPGVGKKTAERIVLELKEKIGKLVVELGGSQSPADAAFEDVVSALINLGYNRAAAEKAARSTDSDQFEQRLKQALALLAG